MITIYEEVINKYTPSNDKLFKFKGLSSDTKPTGEYGGVGIENGSTFFEMDTEKTFHYDEENATWVNGGKEVIPAVEKNTKSVNGYEISFPSSVNDSLGAITTSYTFPNVTVDIGGVITLAYLPFEESYTDIDGATEIEVDGETIYEVEDNGTYKYVRNRVRDIDIKDGSDTVIIKQPESYTYSSATKLNEETLKKLVRGYEVELLMEDGTMFNTSSFPAYYLNLTEKEIKTIFDTYGYGQNVFRISTLNDGSGAGGGSNPILPSSGLNPVNSMYVCLQCVNGYNWSSSNSGISTSHIYRDALEYGDSTKYYGVFYSVGVQSGGTNSMYICRKGVLTYTNQTAVTSEDYYLKIDNDSYKYGLENSGLQMFFCLSKPEGYEFSIASQLTNKYQGATTNPFIMSEEDIRMCLSKTGVDAKDFDGRFIFCIRNGPGMQVVFGVTLEPIETVNITFKDVRGRLHSNEGYHYQGADFTFTIKKGTSLADYGYTSLATTSDSQPTFPSSISANGTNVDASFLTKVQNEDVTYQMVI